VDSVEDAVNAVASLVLGLVLSDEGS